MGAALLGCLGRGGKRAATSRTIRGKLVDAQGRGTKGRVRVRGDRNFVCTDGRGRFQITPPDDRHVVTLCAWEPGCYISAVRASAGDAVTIRLEPYTAEDHSEYEWISSKPSTKHPENCGNCHVGEFYQEWAKSTHALSAANPRFLDMWNGTDAQGRRGVHPGLLLDQSPLSPICATCHIPTISPGETLSYDVNRAAGVAREGIHCDFCHKIVGVDMSHPGLKHGIMGIRLRRPGPARQIFFGGHDDVVTPTLSATFLPLYRKSECCGPCHEGEIRGLPIYETYTEWQRTKYAEKGVECQTCHMAPNGRKRNFAPGHGGINRPPDTVPSHDCPGSHDQELHRASVDLKLRAKCDGDTLHVHVRVTPVNVGHSLPSGYPMRNVVLLVQALDESGQAVEQLLGPRIPAYGGQGGVENGGYAGEPGKVFAKVLCDAKGKHPVPTWRADRILVDNRLKADTTDVSHYAFRLNSLGGKCTVSATLLFRQFFKSTIDNKGWNLPDMLMARKQLVVSPLR